MYLPVYNYCWSVPIIIIYIHVTPRSSLAWKNGIDVMAGVVDQDYTGIVKVVLINHSRVPFEIEVGDYIAQIIPEKIANVVAVEEAKTIE